ncbi:MAG: Abi family protein [Pseudomonadota bacterium]|nr:Abi family protein [Pseudomonadota bacterium]
MSYSKPWLSVAEQLELLEKRGMAVADKTRAQDYLKRIGYYRLSGYWYAFRERDKARQVQDSFRPGTRFQDVVNLYVFDKQLRMLTMDALERIEIALRVDISHSLGKLDAFAYLNPALFDDSFSRKLDANSGTTKHHDWLGKHARLISRSKEAFVHHNRKKYGLPLAIWVACEVWDFGALSQLFAGMRRKEQNTIAEKYGLLNVPESGEVFASWLRSLNYLRNVCAHHGRLWNRNIIDQPRLPAAQLLPWVATFEQDKHARARCFLLLMIAGHLLRVVNPQSSWPQRMKKHLQNFPDLSDVGLNLYGMGAPDGWEQIWQAGKKNPSEMLCDARQGGGAVLGAILTDTPANHN